ncbi:MAG: hypothetical protein ACOX4D_00530, partial [Bacteroidales bacterium]
VMGDHCQNGTLLGLGRAEYLLSLKMDGAFTMGDHNHSGLTTIANDGSTVEVMTTKGMIPWIQELGTTQM